ncbi:hypothetical protein [Mycobacterium sp. NPDC050853]|uniref:hypothetical protein n=1 Tax=Mycobacterium sp. NPDC050853 TaxID=3155160 RepID=UPI0033F3E25C
MGNDNWYGKNDYRQIIDELKRLAPDLVSAKADVWNSIATELNAASNEMKALSGKLGRSDFWTGKAADAAKEGVSKNEQNVALDGKSNSLAITTRHVADILRSDSRNLQAAIQMALSHDPGPDKKKNPDEYDKQLKLLQGYAQSTYTNPLSGEQRKFESAYNPETGGGEPNPVINNTGGGGGGGGQNGGGGGQSPNDANKFGDGKDTKPAFSDGAGSQNGQGQGQGAGSPGGGSGGGSPQSGSGGSGSGLGGALSGLGAGSDRSGAGLAPGTTTSAGFSSPGSGTGTLSGPGALRGGAGIPGPGAGSGTNPAGIGGAGIRGGAMGMGGVGMAGMGGAHGRGGKGEEDDEHQTPEFLINWDNGNELFGDLPKASPGVIGDWTEHERAEKQRRESEKRRYKSMGWNVDFGDED